MHRYTKIILVNEVFFIVSSLIFFYLGADRILPTGFVVIIFGVGAFATIQYFYMKKFLKELTHRNKKLFFKNLLIFLIVGFCLSLVAIFSNTLKINYVDYSIIIFNLVLVSVPVVMYGIWFYFCNIILLKIIK